MNPEEIAQLNWKSYVCVCNDKIEPLGLDEVLFPTGYQCVGCGDICCMDCHVRTGRWIDLCLHFMCNKCYYKYDDLTLN